MEVKSRRAVHTEATRAALVKAGRQLFGRHGYEAVSVDAIARRARGTTGALYHHFGDKRALFRAVFELVDSELYERVAAAAATPSDGFERFIAGAEAWFESCRAGEVRQIVLLDGPSVLGWEEWRGIDAPYSFDGLVMALSRAMEDGVLQRRPARPLAHLLYGALNEGGIALARADDFGAAKAEMLGLFSALLGGLRGT
jgi:AcrR family transcriptional regulator